MLWLSLLLGNTSCINSLRVTATYPEIYVTHKVELCCHWSMTLLGNHKSSSAADVLHVGSPSARAQGSIGWWGKCDPASTMQQEIGSNENGPARDYYRARGAVGIISTTRFAPPPGKANDVEWLRSPRSFRPKDILPVIRSSRRHASLHPCRFAPACIVGRRTGWQH